MTPSPETIQALTFLLPGFVAVAVFYSLTSHPKPDAFGHVIHALIFTAIVQALTEGFFFSSRWKLLFSVPTAVVLALIAVILSNTDWMHRLLRHIRVTKETSYPSVWYSSFAQNKDCYVVLHLKGQRRLYGWPDEPPSRPDQDYFRITEAVWLDENNKMIETETSAILIPVDEVEMVEFKKGTNA